MRLRGLAISLFGILAILGNEVNAKAMSLTQLADAIQVNYQVLSNLDNQDCKALFSGDCFTGKLRFSLPESVTSEPFALYFSHIAPIKWDNHPQLDIEHINGDLHQVLFRGNEFSDGTAVDIQFKAAFWHAAHSDVMPNYFLVSDTEGPLVVQSTIPEIDKYTGLQVMPHLLPFESEQQWRRNPEDNLPLADATWLYQHYQTLQAEPEKAETPHSSVTPRIIPQVKKAEWNTAETLSLDTGIKVNWQEFTEDRVIQELFQKANIATTQNGVPLTLKLNNELAESAYRLQIENKGINIEAADRKGLQHGMVSFYQLLAKQGSVLPLVDIQDEPRYEFRGVHVDLSRNFLGKQVLYRLLDQMFYLKLNKLHLHLADDEGWRLQIPGLPELTEIGGFRCFDPQEDSCLLPQLGSGPHKNSAVNGYLTVSEYQALLQYAHERHIEIIPSFDLPGHARAAVKAMEARYRKYKKQENLAAAEEFLLSDFADDTQYSSVQFYHDNTVNPCQESTYHFIDTVIGKVKAMHKAVNAPLSTYHIGADETAGAWVNSPVCQTLIETDDTINSVQDLKPMFLTRVIDIIEKHGLIAAGWSDGMHKVLELEAGKQHQVNVWDTLYWNGHELVKAFDEQGWKTVLSHPDVLYFDFPYANHPKETGYYWASKNTDSVKVFQFMPDNLAANASQWTDRMGHSYTASNQGTQPGIAGMQSQIWSEAVRSPETFEYLMYPRLQTFAERAWHKADWEVQYGDAQTFSYQDKTPQSKQQLRDWQGFSAALAGYMSEQKLFRGNYRLPPPGMRKSTEGIKVNTLWQGLGVQCRLDEQPWFEVSGRLVKESKASQLSCRTVQKSDAEQGADAMKIMKVSPITVLDLRAI
ncbi:family 20 glycosylhydrolase [Planctobacterium marinum]|uniref:beta-N-acetylhexosaminidase n=1 Tax=Planctobacterium marinum TaxID=1631968 RepID=A0AA48HTE1_9ALTE|nr:beta-N-acetylhexosaminidase [Planctobacterium marinum]